MTVHLVDGGFITALKHALMAVKTHISAAFYTFSIYS
jgi:hypothetical protein